LSFSTCVAIAAERGAVTLPYGWQDPSAAEFARRHQALLAGPRGEAYSLSPASLVTLPPGTRLVLPSQNGAALSLEAARRGTVLAGCLRNRSAVCARAAQLGGPFAVLPAGERWADGRLRPALEDLLGAGAIVAMLPGTRSPEAAAAATVFESFADRLPSALASCSSGRQLIESGYAADVEAAALLDTADVAPELVDGAYVVVRRGI